MWFDSEQTATCFYCNSNLRLVPRDPKGKRRQVEGNFGFGSVSHFECNVCGCLNDRDENGQIVSNVSVDSSNDRDSYPTLDALNRSRSSTPDRPLFCRQCLSNQSLQIHLLSSYPSSSSDEEEEGEEGDRFPPIEEYRESLDRRYPLVCLNCASRVEDTIRQRDYRVKTGILGGRLRETGKVKLVVQTKEPKRETRQWLVAGAVWRLRAAVWTLHHLTALVLGLSGLLRSSIVHFPYCCDPLSFGVLAVSPLWIFWDPTWNKLRNETKKRGRTKFRVRYRRLYIALQGAAFLSRIGTSIILHLDCFVADNPRRLLFSLLFALNLFALVAPLRIPRLTAPPPILLRSTDSPLRPSTPSSASFLSSPSPESLGLDPNDPVLEPLQNLSLSKRSSILSSSSPRFFGTQESSPAPRSPSISDQTLRSRLATAKERQGRARFGQTSFNTTANSSSSSSSSWSATAPSFPDNLHSSATTTTMHDEGYKGGGGGNEQENSMDWTPLLSEDSTQSTTETSRRGVWFRPRKFVVPDFRPPTGLEGILEKVGLSERDGERMDVDDHEASKPEERDRGVTWWKRWIAG